MRETRPAPIRLSAVQAWAAHASRLHCISPSWVRDLAAQYRALVHFMELSYRRQTEQQRCHASVDSGFSVVAQFGKNLSS